MSMNFATLATGPTAKTLGLLPDEAFWLAVILIVTSLFLEGFLFKSIRDRRVLGQRPVIGATVVLAFLSLLFLASGFLLLFN